MNDIEQKSLAVVDNNDNNELEIDLIELLLRLLERWKSIVAGALVGAVIMGVYSFMFATPIYEATSKLYVLSASDSAINLSDLQIGSYLTKDYTEVFDTWEVHEIVRQNLGLSIDREKLSKMLTVSNPNDTRVLAMTVSNPDPALAAAIANEYASVAKQYISATMKTDEPTDFSEALVPEAPVSPQKARNVALGFILGAFVVCALVVVQFLLDDKIKTSEDIRKYIGIPTLAIIPDNDEAAKVSPKGKAANAGRRN